MREAQPANPAFDHTLSGCLPGRLKPAPEAHGPQAAPGRISAGRALGGGLAAAAIPGQHQLERVAGVRNAARGVITLDGYDRAPSSIREAEAGSVLGICER